MLNMAKTDSSAPRLIFVHSARTAVAGIASLLIAQLCRIPEPFWAPITTIVITQSSLGAALTVSRQRFVGTILGAGVATVAASIFDPHSHPALAVVVFGLSVFVLGLICEWPHLGMTAYRFGGITVVLVLLVPFGGEPPWRIAFHRFASVSIGILTALILARIWPEKEPAAQ